jgi:lipopolysaccharide export system protein LptA
MKIVSLAAAFGLWAAPAWAAGADAPPSPTPAAPASAPSPFKPPAPKAPVAGSQPAAPAEPAPIPAALGKSLPGLLPGARGDAPVEIDAKDLRWRDAERMADYAGDVVVVQGEGSLHASRLRIYLSKGAEGGIAAAAAGSSDIRRVEADGPVTVIQKDQVAAGDQGVYDKAQGSVVLTGRQVVLSQGDNAASGAKLVYKLASRDVTLEPARGAKIRTHLVQSPNAGATAAGGKSADGKSEPEGVIPGGSSRDPVQIEARRLEWRDATQTAVYVGDVTAVQGEGSMRASKLTIFVERDGPGQGAGAKRAATGPTAAGRIRRMEAAGPVTLVQKDQVATGARAVYDRAANRVELIGGVVLSQGENVTTGARLVYDLTTKRAVMSAGGRARAQAQFTPGKGGDLGAAPAKGARR